MRFQVLLGAISACAHRPAPIPASTEAVAADEVVVDAKAVGIWWGKPPLKEISLDVTVRNPTSEARWLVLPRTFPSASDSEPRPGGAECEIQIFELAHEPRTAIAEGVCANFWAVRLAPGAVLALSKLRVEAWWQDVPAAVDLEVLIAKDVIVGGESLGAIVGDGASPGGEFAAPTGASDPRAASFWHPHDGRTEGESVPVEIAIESRAEVTVALAEQE
jgi:hypothetical protein